MKWNGNELKQKFLLVGAVAAVVLAVGIAAAPPAHALIGNLVDGFLGGSSVGSGSVTIRADNSLTSVTNTLRNTLTNSLTQLVADATESLNLKELTLDGIAWNLGKELIQQIQADVLDWANSGFDGEPAFVTNYEEFFTNIADETVAGLIYGSEFDLICAHVDISVRTAIARHYNNVVGRGDGGPTDPGTGERQCLFEVSVEGEVEAFLEGDFSQGSWDGWFELTIGSEADPVKAYLNEQFATYNRVADAQRLGELEIIAGGGFRSQKICTPVEDPLGKVKERCEIVMPGSVARDTVSFQVSEVPTLSLLEVDEFNELLSGFMSNLTNQALSSFGGLLSLGDNPRYSNATFGDGTQTYTEALRSDRVVSSAPLKNPMPGALAAERDYQALQQRMLADITNLEARLDAAKAADPSCFDLDLPATLATEKENVINNLAISETTEDLLVVLDTQFTSTTDSATQNLLISQFVSLQQQGLTRTSYQNQELEATYIALTFAEMVQEFGAEIDAAMRACGIVSASAAVRS
jgi:hypothetical protein